MARSEADKTAGKAKWREVARSEADKTGGDAKWQTSNVNLKFKCIFL